MKTFIVHRQPMIGITLGDPAGIGPEITLKALPRFAGKPITLIGSKTILERTADLLGLPIPSGVAWADVGTERSIRFGKVRYAAGRVSLRSLETGVEMLRQGGLDGIVTAPVSKQALYGVGFAFPGQTEFLAARLGAKRHAMMAYAGKMQDCERSDPASPAILRAKRSCKPGDPASEAILRIVFVTIHRPLVEVSGEITVRLVAEKIELLDDFLRNGEHIRSPRIAVLALNPHAWEFTLGEEKRIRSGIKRATGIQAEGPFPADSIAFLLQKYDGIVAMYHDQAMIPAKLLSRGRGVNVTLGLPRIRTSPLHGTAFDIAGKGIASPASMEAAIELCLRLTAGG